MPAFPSGFKPSIQGYSIGAPTGVTQVRVGGGASRFLLDWDRGRQQFQVSMTMPPEKFAVWTLFYHHTIKRGAVSFTMPLDSGFGLLDHDCWMVPGSYSAVRAAGQITTVSFVVEAESGAYALSEAQATALIDAHNGYAAGSTPAIPRDMRPIISGYGFDGPEGVYGSVIEGGESAYAAAWDRDVQRFRVTLILSGAYFQVWTAFFHHTIKKGSRSFTMPLDSGLGVQDHTATVIPESYSAVRNGPQWVVAFVVEAESAAYGYTAADAQSYIDLWEEYGDEYDDLLARIAQFANVDTLVLQL